VGTGPSDGDVTNSNVSDPPSSPPKRNSVQPAQPKASTASIAVGGSGTNTNLKVGAGDICPRCEKKVYFAEQLIGPGSVKYHKTCFRCSECNKLLDSSTFVDNKEGTVFCRQCHGKKFGPKVGFIVRDSRALFSLFFDFCCLFSLSLTIFWKLFTFHILFFFFPTSSN